VFDVAQVLNVLVSVSRRTLYEGVRYNEEKEQQAHWSAKIKELDRIEQAKKNAEKKSGEFSFNFYIVLYCLELYFYCRVLHCIVLFSRLKCKHVFIVLNAF